MCKGSDKEDDDESKSANCPRILANVLQVEVQIKSLELQAIDCALSLEGVHAGRQQVRALSSRQEAAMSRSQHCAALLDASREEVGVLQQEFEALLAQERALDRAARRELGGREEEGGAGWVEVEVGSGCAGNRGGNPLARHAGRRSARSVRTDGWVGCNTSTNIIAAM
jgi:hypothetical protein